MTGWQTLYRLQRLFKLGGTNAGTIATEVAAGATSTTGVDPAPVSATRILNAWLPLAATWMLMTGEGPLLAAAIARQFDPQQNLAAWSVVFPIVLILGAPGLTLLSVSTSMVRDMDTYYQIRRFVFWLMGIMVAMHLLIAFTPLYDLLMVYVVGAPPELLEPVRLGFRIMLPFSAAVAFRRFCNGILVRFGRSSTITIGAILRLLTNGFTLIITWMLGFSGIVMATSAITMSVIAELTYATLVTRPVLAAKLRPAPTMEKRLTLRAFSAFYVPLVLTTLIYILLQPMIAAALSRMPHPISSLAAWPVLYGIVMLISSSAFAYTEVVVVMLDEPNAQQSLIRFTVMMGGGMVAVLFLFNATELATFWLRTVAALPEDLIPAVRSALWLAIPLPAFSAIDSLFSGTLMKNRRTRAVTEAALISICTVGLVLMIGVFLGRAPGLLVGITASLIGGSLRTIWLGRRAWGLLNGG